MKGMYTYEKGIFRFDVGYTFDGALISIQIPITRHEVAIRLDLIFFGLYVGLGF